ncbi:uncharacterized protein LOC108631637 [Ceratina calcarata]|uniref:Methylated-DNA--protein-cysteine methyltransferase n=1 Tax=Ceratina calcarata TaxID=156304 RepID=A0AAJ7JEF2_9HYME|nr:uncharacterized protein LOC108631637 [Ceratina calcarata]
MVRFQTMTVQEYKARHADFQITYAFHPTPLWDSPLLLGIISTDKAIVFLGFAGKGNEEAVARLKKHWPLSELTEDVANDTVEIMKRILSVRVGADDSLVVLMKGTEFELEVWTALFSISEGSTCTYEEVARKVGRPKAARAVGNAVKKNSIAYLVPCHRVVGKSGSNKYFWGTECKETVMAYERKFLDL